MSQLPIIGVLCSVRTFELKKLVTDRIAASMQELGQKMTTRRLDQEEIAQMLAQKVVEEGQEYAAAPAESRHEEAVDVLVALFC